MGHLLLLICALITSPQEDKGALLGTVYFNTGKSTLTAQSDSVLNGIAERIRAEPNLMIGVYGYTDNTGSNASNIAVSKERAEHVKQRLADMLGENGDRIETYGLGSRNPIASNNTKAGRKKNRRVEISIREPDAILTWHDNDVKVQPPFLRPRWLIPTPDYYLYHDYVVTTGKMSHAHILYPNKSVLKMDEEAMVIVHRLDMEREDDQLVKDIKMQNGSLETMLNDEKAQGDTIAIISSAKHKNNSISSETAIEDKLKDLIAAYEGDTTVAPAKETPVVVQKDVVIPQQKVISGRPAGFGVGVFAGEPAGISLKTWRNKQYAFDVEVGWSFPDEVLYVVGDYLVHFPKVIKTNGLFPYLGVGVELRGDKNNSDWEFNPGIRLGGGVEYIQNRFGIFGELYPVIELVPRTPVSVSGGIGVRYYFTD
ncbi:MAG: OmpA family protein [candidate division WOR-3 bacterium]|nr:MAG: OmpA family protein [candidate division WOR-3 bacterium]